MFPALTDFIDGYLARRYQSETVLGKLMDPLADKVLVTTALIMLIPLGKIPAWVCLLIICREIIVTGFRGLAATTGKVSIGLGALGLMALIRMVMRSVQEAFTGRRGLHDD